jgi:p21-activated kinase 1
MTPDSCTPSHSSGRISRRGALYHSWTRGSIRSYQQSVSGSSLQTTSTVTANYQAPFDLSGIQYPLLISSASSRNQYTSVPDSESCDILETLTFRLRNKSQSTISTILGSERSGCSTTPSTLSVSSIRDRDASPPSSTSVSPGPPHPSNANTVNIFDPYPDHSSPTGHGLVPSPPFDQFSRESYGDPHTTDTTASSAPIASFSPPVVRVDTASCSRSGTVTAKANKGMVRSMAYFLNSNKRPASEIGTRYDGVHITDVDFNPSNNESSGLPREWQQLLQCRGISKSDQEKNPLAVAEIVKFYQEGNADMSHLHPRKY